MFFSASTVVLSLALTAFAAPRPLGAHSSLEKRSSTTCGGLNGIAGFFDTTFNFTLTALNDTLPNANQSGSPLVLGPIGESGGVHLEALSTFASVPLNDWPNLSLINGTLIANMQVPGEAPLPTVATQVVGGDTILFSTTNKPIAPNPVFCAIADTDPEGGSPFPSLAVGTDADSFSLCLIPGSTQNNIIYKASATNDGTYDFSTCYSVNVLIHEPM